MICNYSIKQNNSMNNLISNSDQIDANFNETDEIIKINESD